MLDPRGNTAVYLLYAGARICSILRKAYAKGGYRVAAAGIDEKSVNAAHIDELMRVLLAKGARVALVDEYELQLGSELLKFHEVVEHTLTTLLPSALCDYLYGLCNDFTKFYQHCKVIGSPEQDQRLLLIRALEKALRKGYSLLGIGFLEKL